MMLATTTGKKLNLSNISQKHSESSNVITGFGYALDDLFENENVNMDTIIRKEIEQDVSSPFKSPNK